MEDSEQGVSGNELTGPGRTPDPPHGNPSSGNRTKLMVAGCGLSSGAALMYSSLPFFIGILTANYLFDEQRAGFVASSYILGYALASASAYLWITRSNWRIVLATSMVLAAILFLAYPSAKSYFLVIAFQGCIGCLMGTVFTILMAAMGNLDEPERAYGIKNASEIGFGALVIFVLSGWIVPHWAFSGVSLAYAAILLALVPLAAWIPSRSADDRPTAVSSGSGVEPASLFGLLSLLIHFGGLTSLWAFLERIGTHNLLNQKEIGFVLSLTLVAGIFGSLFATWVGTRWNRTLINVLANGTILFAIGLFGLSSGSAGYVSATLVFGISWNFFIPYQMGIVAETSPDGRMVALVPAAAAIGATIGPALAGTIIVSAGYGTFYALVACSAVLGAACYAIATGMMRKESAIRRGRE